MIDSFGTCAYCAEDALVKVNWVPMCSEHMEGQFHGIGKTVREIVRRIADADQ